MYEITRTKMSLKSRREWKKRPAGGPVSVKVEKTPEEYEYQLKVLSDCLLGFFQEKNLVQSKINEYLEVSFFFDYLDIDKKYMDELLNHGLKVVLVEKLVEGTQIYFKIINYDKAYGYLSLLLKQFDDYVYNGVDLVLKRIKLWKYFRLSTRDVKDGATFYVHSFNRLSLRIDFIENIPKKEFREYVLSAAIKSSIDISNIFIKKNVIVIEDIPDSERRSKNFIQKIASFDKVRFVSLGDFVSYVERGLEGQKIDYSEMRLAKVGSAAPVIAVIDSGVQMGYLTRDFLVGGLDFTNRKSILSGNPYVDNLGHGTAVACEIVYGENINDYFMNKSASMLYPLAKIFSVKVFDNENENDVDYENIFKIGGEFSKAVAKFNIKVVNISFNKTVPKDFDEISVSKSADLLDAFAEKYNVIFVVSTGNILPEFLKKLSNKYRGLEFYKRPNYFLHVNNKKYEREINIAPPAEQISGITVGSCEQQRSKVVVSSFSRSFKLSTKSYFAKPDVVAVGGGDYPVDLSNSVPEFCFSSGRKPVVHPSFQYLELGAGTSFSAPRVSRALGMGLIKYPDLSAEELKGIFLHKISNYKISCKKNGFLNSIIQKYNFEFDNSFRGKGALLEKEGDIIFSDTENQVTFILKGKIRSGEILTYEVPIAKMLGDGTRNMYNKLQLKTSVCILPSSKHGSNLTLESSNTFHIAALTHSASLSPTTIIYKPKKVFKDQCIKMQTPGVLVNGWTCDYYNKHKPTFSSKYKNYIKDELLDLIGHDDKINISVRGLDSNNINNEEKTFALIFSVEDLGATGQIRNDINIEL